jgi:hypothetical protein
MKTPVIFLILLLFASFAGCAKIGKAPEEELRTLAYESLSKEEKQTILDWTKAPVVTIKPPNSLLIWSPQGSLDLKGREVVVVTFSTTQDPLLGPIKVYLDAETHEILGKGLRL